MTSSSGDRSTRFATAIAAIDAANAEDPRTEIVDGAAQPVEFVYGRRMSAALLRLQPDAGELVQLAARAQHIRRWTIPRTSFTEGKAGYHRWRNTLKRAHGDMAAEILVVSGYRPDEIDRVRALIGKVGLGTDAGAQSGAQAIEDAACLVFLEHHFAAFAAKHEPDKVIDIVRKTWGKMSAAGHAAALALPLPVEARALVERALSA